MTRERSRDRVMCFIPIHEKRRPPAIFRRHRSVSFQIYDQYLRMPTICIHFLYSDSDWTIMPFFVLAA